MKKFNKFLEEISLKGNEGIRGEKDKNEPKYLSDIEKRGRKRHDVEGMELPPMPPGMRPGMRPTGPPPANMPSPENMRKLHDVMMRLQVVMKKSSAFVKGKEAELEKLAEDVIRQNYGSILDNVEFDIKIEDPNALLKSIDCEVSDCEMPSYQLLEDPEVKREIDKRKIANNITQGEAKNTKHILNMPEIVDGVK